MASEDGLSEEVEQEIIDAFEEHNARVLGVSVEEMRGMRAEEVRERLLDLGILQDQPQPQRSA